DLLLRCRNERGRRIESQEGVVRSQRGLAIGRVQRRLPPEPAITPARLERRVVGERVFDERLDKLRVALRRQQMLALTLMGCGEVPVRARQEGIASGELQRQLLEYRNGIVPFAAPELAESSAK